MKRPSYNTILSTPVIFAAVDRIVLQSCYVIRIGIPSCQQQLPEIYLFPTDISLFGGMQSAKLSISILLIAE